MLYVEDVPRRVRVLLRGEFVAVSDEVRLPHPRDPYTRIDVLRSSRSVDAVRGLLCFPRGRTRIEDHEEPAGGTPGEP